MVSRCAGVGALVLIGLAIPASANAAEIFGSDLTLAPIPPPAPECTGPGTGPCTDVAFTFHTGNTLPTTAPVDGVITSVRYRSSTSDTVTLRLARLNVNDEAMGVGTGPTATLNPSGAVTEVPVNPGLPIQTGDYLAGDGSTGTTFNCTPGAGATGSFHLYLPPLVDGDPPRARTTQNTCEILVQATIEPDADGDRLGDESQDNCTGLGTPDTTNTDGDALGDACDPDDDNDTVADAADNCPLTANPSQSNVDGDALGDACDLIDNRPIDGQVPTAVLGRILVARTISGTVTIALPPGATATGRARASQKGLTFVPLEQVTEIPVGSFLNTRRGTVGLTAAVDTAGKTQSGMFSRGLFQVLQSRRRSARGLTELRLKGSSFRGCRRAQAGGSATAAQLSRRTIRRLRANARGRFRTGGRNSSATVRGTIWEVADRCDGTLTKVRRGRVAVRDFRRKKTVIVRAGKSYLARARP
jgi:thrombospondin type 3 repeat protein